MQKSIEDFKAYTARNPHREIYDLPCDADLTITLNENLPFEKINNIAMIMGETPDDMKIKTVLTEETLSTVLERHAKYCPNDNEVDLEKETIPPGADKSEMKTLWNMPMLTKIFIKLSYTEG